MILEVTPENLRDIAAAVSAALKLVPTADELREVEAKVLVALSRREEAIELNERHAEALRNALLERAWAQRENAEAFDYSDLADRIARALDDQAVQLEEP